MRLEIAEKSSIYGRVLDPRDRPIPGARVWLRTWDFSLNAQADGSVIEVLTDREGRYSFPDAQPGGHYLEVVLEGRRPKAGRVEPFELEAGGTEQRDLRVLAPSGGPGG